MALIEKLVGKVIRKGRLNLLMPDGRKLEFGPGGDKALTVRLTDRKAAFAIALVLGISAALVAVPLQTRLQELVSEERRGKVFGAQNTLLNVATTLPLATAGFLVERLGIQQVIGAVGALMLLAAGWGWWTRRADV